MKLKYLLIPSVIALIASFALSVTHRNELIEKRKQRVANNDKIVAILAQISKTDQPE